MLRLYPVLPQDAVFQLFKPQLKLAAQSLEGKAGRIPVITVWLVEWLQLASLRLEDLHTYKRYLLQDTVAVKIRQWSTPGTKDEKENTILLRLYQYRKSLQWQRWLQRCIQKLIHHPYTTWLCMDGCPNLKQRIKAMWKVYILPV